MSAPASGGANGTPRGAGTAALSPGAGSEKGRQEGPVGDLAVFDFDGTLTTRDSFFDFVAWRRPRAGLAWDLAATSPLVLLYAARLVGNEAHKMALFSRRFAGADHGQFAALSRDYSAQRVPGLLRAAAVERLLHHRRLGHRVAIVSASFGDWIQPWADTVGVEAVIASRPEVAAGRLTGRMQGANCHGPEKLRRLLELYPDRGAYRLHAYGDSRGDQALLEAADHGYYRRFA